MVCFAYWRLGCVLGRLVAASLVVLNMPPSMLLVVCSVQLYPAGAEQWFLSPVCVLLVVVSWIVTRCVHLPMLVHKCKFASRGSPVRLGFMVNRLIMMLEYSSLCSFGLGADRQTRV